MREGPRIISRLRNLLFQQPWTTERVGAYLLVVSSIYLALPHFIFFVGWLQWPWATLAWAILGVGLVVVARSVLAMGAQGVDGSGHANEAGGDWSGGDRASAFVFTRQHALMIGATGLLWLTISGVGGFVAQDLDWNKHNMVLYSLMDKPWPTVYEIYKVDVPLVYYIGYYLPAALVGKVGGWYWANQALFWWSFAGLMIALLWFCVLVQRASYSALLIFVFFSGLDVVGKAIADFGHVWNIPERRWDHLDGWARVWQYSSHATLLNWVPHQGLAGWIVIGMTIYCIVNVRQRGLSLLPFGLSALWSPFVTVGVIPYLALDFLMGDEPFAQRIRQFFSIPNVAGLAAMAVTGFYFSSKLSEGSPVVIQSMHGGLSIAKYAGPPLDAILFLLVFCLLEFGLFAIVLYRSGAVEDERWRWVFDSTVVTLCVLPWFTLGVFNDLVMRGAIPALFVLAVVVARTVHDTHVAKRARRMLVVLLLLGASTAVVEFQRHFGMMLTLPAPILDDMVHRWDLVRYMRNEVLFFGQYSGAIDSPFFKYAAKPIAQASEAVAGSEEYELNRHDYVLYGNQIYLLRDMVGLPAQIAAGETVTVPWQLHFFGPAHQPMLEPTLRLVDSADVPVWESDEWPVAEPEIKLTAMTEWSGVMTVTVPSTATTGIYQLVVGFLDSRDGLYLEAQSVPEGVTLGEIVPVASVEVIGE